MEGKDSDYSDGFGDNNMPINLNSNLNDENPNENAICGKETDSGQSKLCARGHWRPSEDTKLKELVALYGPQNWNLIAEKLEGRSGKIVAKNSGKRKSVLSIFVSLKHFSFSDILLVLESLFL